MGMRRRTRRRALVAGAAIGHHQAKMNAEANAAAPVDQYEEQAPAAEPAQYAPAPPDPYEAIDHLAALHASGALTDEEFAAEKAKVLGS
jgi:hypothetical protein